jgi:hypothetical protein
LLTLHFIISRYRSAEIKGTALTLCSIGFATTIISIQLISGLKTVTDTNYIYICLAIGPILGLLALSKKNGIDNLCGLKTLAIKKSLEGLIRGLLYILRGKLIYKIK